MIDRELDKLLKKRTDFIGQIYPYYKRNHDSNKIARKIGHKSPTTITVFTTTLDYLFKKKPLDYRMWKSIEQLEYRLKEWIAQTHSAELTQYFQELADECAKRGEKSVFYSPEETLPHSIQNHSSKPIEEAQKSIPYKPALEKQPGVYVYSYPQYLLAEAFDNENKTLLKIGASGNVDRRVERQSRQTEVPEDLKTLRIYLTENPFDIEKHFHNILIASGQHHKSTAGGIEWFRTNLATVDAIAEALGLSNSAEPLSVI